MRKLLGIKGDSDVARVMHVFLGVDIRGTHKLDIETFFEYFGIEFSEYNKRAFRLLAFGDGQVTTLMVSEQRFKHAIYMRPRKYLSSECEERKEPVYSIRPTVCCRSLALLPPVYVVERVFRRRLILSVPLLWNHHRHLPQQLVHSQEGQGGRRGSTSGRSAGISLKFDQFFVSMYNYGGDRRTRNTRQRLT